MAETPPPPPPPDHPSVNPELHLLVLAALEQHSAQEPPFDPKHDQNARLARKAAVRNQTIADYASKARLPQT